MSLNQVNSSGELERVAGLVNSEKINEMYEAFPSDASANNKLVTNDDIFLEGDRRYIIGWADLSNDESIDGSSNFANNIGRIEGHNAIIQVRNPSTSYQWPVTNSGDNNEFIDFGSSMQFFIDRVNNHLFVRYSDSTDMSSWGKIVTEKDFNYKSGTVNFNCGANQWTTVDVTFDSPMPDTDYVVTLESSNTAYVHVQNVTTKTTNGFIIIVWNRDELAGDRQGIINWQAYKIPH